MRGSSRERLNKPQYMNLVIGLVFLVLVLSTTFAIQSMIARVEHFDEEYNRIVYFDGDELINLAALNNFRSHIVSMISVAFPFAIVAVISLMLLLIMFYVKNRKLEQRIADLDKQVSLLAHKETD